MPRHGQAGALAPRVDQRRTRADGTAARAGARHAGRRCRRLPPPRILTDSEGRFAFRDLTRGNYSLNATKTGYAGGCVRPQPAGRPDASAAARRQRTGDGHRDPHFQVRGDHGTDHRRSRRAHRRRPGARISAETRIRTTSAVGSRHGADRRSRRVPVRQSHARRVHRDCADDVDHGAGRRDGGSTSGQNYSQTSAELLDGPAVAWQWRAAADAATRASSCSPIILRRSTDRAAGVAMPRSTTRRAQQSRRLK